jgi:hypothetical protein
MTENINKFLDATDLVLNSNSLLLIFPSIGHNSPEECLSEILSSGNFEQEFLKQDRERGWHNYHRIDQDSQWIPRDTTKKHVKQTDPAMNALTFAECKKVLLSTLTLQILPNRYFSSPYGKGKTIEEAEPLVQDFLEAIGACEPDCRIYEIEPVFLYSHNVEVEAKSVRSYFYNLGSDCAFLFCAKDNSYILLLNGSD